VTISKRPSQTIRIHVKDSGLGLSAQKISQLFQPFNRLGQEAGSVQGTGIGLVMSKRLVEVMGGTMGVESCVGTGSEFWFDLAGDFAPQPGTITGKNYAIRKDTATSSARVRTLLYVEDNPANMELVQQIIAKRPDLRLVTATNGADGVAIAREQHPDLILMDINLPGLSGLDALRMLKADALTVGIPVLAISANAMPSDIKGGLDAGFVRYLTKPIKVDEFMQVVDRALQSL
jgi:CheY-like chemotaxis protein